MLTTVLFLAAAHAAPPPAHLVTVDGWLLSDQDDPELDESWSTGVTWTTAVGDRLRAGAGLGLALADDPGSGSWYRGELLSREDSRLVAWPVRPRGVVEWAPVAGAPGLHLTGGLSLRGIRFLKSAGWVPDGAAAYRDPVGGLLVEPEAGVGYRLSSRRGWTVGAEAGVRARAALWFGRPNRSPAPVLGVAGLSIGRGWTPGVKPPPRKRWSPVARRVFWYSLGGLAVAGTGGWLVAKELRQCGEFGGCRVD